MSLFVQQGVPVQALAGTPCTGQISGKNEHHSDLPIVADARESSEESDNSNSIALYSYQGGGVDNVTPIIIATEFHVAPQPQIINTIATEFHVAPQPQIINTIATEFHVAPQPQIIDTIATEFHVWPESPSFVETTKRGPYTDRVRLRSDAARRAEQVAEAIFYWAQQNQIPWFAVGIDQARIVELLDWDPSRFADRSKVWKALRYAERIGLIAILESGRPRPDRDSEGVPGLYAVFGTDAGEALKLSDAQIEQQRIIAMGHISESFRTRVRIGHLVEKLAGFDRLNPNIRKRKRRKKNLPQVDQE